MLSTDDIAMVCKLKWPSYLLLSAVNYSLHSTAHFRTICKSFVGEPQSVALDICLYCKWHQLLERPTLYTYEERFAIGLIKITCSAAYGDH